MQANDPQTGGQTPASRPRYALDFRASGVALMRRESGVATWAPGRGFSVSQRAGGAWSEIACCDWLPPENEGAPSALDAPERLTAALGDAEPEVDVWVPNGLLLSRTVPDRKRAEDEPAERVAARAISGLTILRPEALELAAIRTESGVALRAVERSVLDEVAAHARRLGFSIRTIRSRPGDRDFPDGAVFSISASQRQSARKSGGPRSGALTLAGGAAVIAAAVAIFFYAAPPAPDAPEPPAISASAPAPSQADAKPAPPYRTLTAEVPFSAPADQFTPAAEQPAPAETPTVAEADAPEPVTELASINADALAIEPGEAPGEVVAAETTATATAEAPAIDAPASLSQEAAPDLAALAPLSDVAVDDDAGAPGQEIVAPEESAQPEGEPTPPQATEPSADAASDPPGHLGGLEEMGDADYAALSLEEAQVPPAPPAPTQEKKNPPPVPRPAMRPGVSPEEPLTPEDAEDNRPAITENAPEKARRPNPRPKSVAKEAAEDAPVEITSLAPETVAAPRPRPAHIRELPAQLRAAAERARAERAAQQARSSAAPTAAVIAEAATQHMEWETLDGFILIGVFERVGSRSALIRLPNGDVRRVADGERIGRWTVASVDDSAVTLTFEGQRRTLHLPGAN